MLDPQNEMLYVKCGTRHEPQVPSDTQPDQHVSGRDDLNTEAQMQCVKEVISLPCLSP